MYICYSNLDDKLDVRLGRYTYTDEGCTYRYYILQTVLGYIFNVHVNLFIFYFYERTILFVNFCYFLCHILY